LPAKPITLYKEFARAFGKDRRSDDASAGITAICEASLRQLAKAERADLVSKVPGKDYFSFKNSAGKLSRPVNKALFDDDAKGVAALIDALRRSTAHTMRSEEITRACYTTAMSFSCVVDLEKTGDQKTPGTFFEYLICHLFARRLGVDPQTRVEVVNLDRKFLLPTDFVFNLGVDRPKFHLPVKTSTRERVIQVWAHQRVLDGVFGMGRFLGTLVCLTETKLDHTKLEVIEICLPDQWRLYQMFIAQMARIYYLDVPRAYESLNKEFPRIHVRPFGEFFHEADSLCL
jgi:hypothetical protein